LVAPLFLAPFYSATEATLGTTVFGLLLVSVAYGGGPYLVFVVVHLWWGRRRSVAEMIRAAWLAPALFAPAAAALICAVMAYSTPPAERGEVVVLFALFSVVYAIVIGYAYVLVVMSIRWLLGHAGLMEWDRVG
jgi:hypothetical protein